MEIDGIITESIAGGFLGTCTLMIAMLNLFPPRDLPDPPRGPPLMSSDVSTFYDLHESAIKVFQTCVNWLHQVGYQDVGK